MQQNNSQTYKHCSHCMKADHMPGGCHLKTRGIATVDLQDACASKALHDDMLKNCPMKTKDTATTDMPNALCKHDSCTFKDLHAP